MLTLIRIIPRFCPIPIQGDTDVTFLIWFICVVIESRGVSMRNHEIMPNSIIRQIQASRKPADVHPGLGTRISLFTEAPVTGSTWSAIAIIPPRYCDHVWFVDGYPIRISSDIVWWQGSNQFLTLFPKAAKHTSAYRLKSCTTSSLFLHPP